MPKKTLTIKQYFIPKDYYAPCMYAFDVLCITKSLYKATEEAYKRFSKTPNTHITKANIRKHLIRWIQSS